MPGIGFTHVTIYELDDTDVAGQAARTLDAEDALRSAGRVHAAHAAVGADVPIAPGPFAEKPESSPSLHGHILTNVLCNDPAREAEWDDWTPRSPRSALRCGQADPRLGGGKGGTGLHRAQYRPPTLWPWTLPSRGAACGALGAPGEL
jgi:hypothetical protein